MASLSPPSRRSFCQSACTLLEATPRVPHSQGGLPSPRASRYSGENYDLLFSVSPNSNEIPFLATAMYKRHRRCVSWITRRPLGVPGMTDVSGTREQCAIDLADRRHSKTKPIMSAINSARTRKLKSNNKTVCF